MSLHALYIRRLSLVVSHYDIQLHNKTKQGRLMLLVAIAWIYVVLMVAVVEATSPRGTLLGAFFTLLLYGVLPLAIVSYLLLSPARKRARRAGEAAEAASTAPVDPDHGGHPAGDAVAPERKEP
ncbi:MAG: hypothetical protein V4750_17795 [Pseudomonadota bacterium]